MGKHIQSFNEHSKNEKLDLSDVSDSEKITMVFGDNDTIFKKFDDEYTEDTDFLEKNEGKVKLTPTGFAEEWSESVDYDKSFAYIDGNKLYVVVYGIPEYINRNTIEKYYERTLEQYIEQGYGEFFETEPGCPICMIVERNGKEVIV